jgi:hypothetical protein
MPKVPQGEGSADALVQKVSRQNIIQLGRLSAPLRSASCSARFCMMDSPFSQVLFTEKGVLVHLVEVSPSGPFFSNFPPMLANDSTDGGFASNTVCRPKRFVNTNHSFCKNPE